MFRWITWTTLAAGTTLPLLGLLTAAQAAPVRVVSPEVSRPCAALLETMMARDPRDRHADWDAVEKDLQRVLDGEWPLTPCPPKKASMLQRSPEDSAREKGETRSAFRRMAYPSVACIAIATLLILVVAHSGDPTRDGMSPDYRGIYHGVRLARTVP